MEKNKLDKTYIKELGSAKSLIKGGNEGSDPKVIGTGDQFAVNDLTTKYPFIYHKCTITKLTVFVLNPFFKISFLEDIKIQEEDFKFSKLSLKLEENKNIVLPIKNYNYEKLHKDF